MSTSSLGELPVFGWDTFGTGLPWLSLNGPHRRFDLEQTVINSRDQVIL